MPIYEYQCDACGIRREKLWRSISRSKPSIPCECGLDMRKLVSSSNFKFSHPPRQTRGMAPPSTGTSDDWNFDKVIGRDSEEKWKKIESRNSVKDSVIRDEHRAGKVVSRSQLVPKLDGSGEYRTITETERISVNRNRETVRQVSEAVRSQGVDLSH